MSEHTSGKIAVAMGGGKFVSVTTDDYSRLVCKAPSSEDARRLVACWNACEGISTEQLEAAPYKDSAAFMAYLKVEAQRDDLLAALKDCTTEEGPDQDTLNRARSAIAKAEAGRGEG